MSTGPEIQAGRGREALERILGEMGSVLVGFSGGVDSTFLLHEALRALGGDNVLAVTARSRIFPSEQLETAAGLAREIGVPHMFIDSSELGNREFRDNPPERCYICKKELFSTLLEMADRHGLDHVADGSNADDPADYRPGLRALRELGIRSPLLEAGLGKQHIRLLSRRSGLPTWDMPTSPCLCSRIPYGTEITEPALANIDRGERFLRGKGFGGGLRVRHHGDLVRLEVEPGDIARLIDPGLRREVLDLFKGMGYTYVSLDLEGFRTGSLNEVLPGDTR